MTKLDLIEFLKCGEFSSLPFGTEKQFVLSAIGEPDWILDNADSSVIRYEQIEFYFQHLTSGLKLLDGVVLHPLDEAHKGVNFMMECEWLTNDLNIEDVKGYLNSLKVDFIEIASEADPQIKMLRTTGGVEFLFFPEDNQICKAGRFQYVDGSKH